MKQEDFKARKPFPRSIFTHMLQHGAPLNSSVSNHEKLLLLAEWVNGSPPSLGASALRKCFVGSFFFLINTIDFLI